MINNSAAFSIAGIVLFIVGCIAIIMGIVIIISSVFFKKCSGDSKTSREVLSSKGFTDEMSGALGNAVL